LENWRRGVKGQILKCMEIKTTNKTQSPKNAPPPDRPGKSRKKAANKLSSSRVTGRKILSVFKFIGKLGAFFMIALFMLSVFLYAYRSEKFNLRKVEFIGCKELDPKHLEEIVRNDFPPNILSISLHQLKDRIEKETWAKRVEIRRILPSDIIIYIQERVPAVIVEMQNELMMVDKEGILLEKYTPEYGKLDAPVFKGTEGEDPDGYRSYQDENSSRIHKGLEMLTEVETDSPHDAKKISEVDVSDRDNIKVLLVDEVAEVSLGDRDFAKRFRALMANMGQFYELKGKYGEIESVDMRFEDKIVWLPIRAKATNSKIKGN
jgi:cell division septal protein FtsQ